MRVLLTDDGEGALEEDKESVRGGEVEGGGASVVTRAGLVALILSLFCSLRPDFLLRRNEAFLSANLAVCPVCGGSWEGGSCAGAEGVSALASTEVDSKSTNDSAAE